MKALLFACCVVLLAAGSANADLAPSKPADQKVSQADKKPKQLIYTGLEITSDPNARTAKLQISQSDLAEMRAALAATTGNGPIVGGMSLSPGRTVIAGLLMFLALSVAGILFARSGAFRRSQKTVAALLLVGFVIGAAAIITRGNAGPPEWYRWRTLPQALSEGKPTYGSVAVEVVPDDQMSGKMKLIIPLKKQNNPGEE